MTLRARLAGLESNRLVTSACHCKGIRAAAACINIAARMTVSNSNMLPALILDR
jgi:uncharacterized membrane protein YqgA involved in biofilm formation